MSSCAAWVRAVRRWRRSTRRSQRRSRCRRCGRWGRLSCARGSRPPRNGRLMLLAHATEYVPMVRRRVDRETVLRETPAELLASSWRHTTARAVAGRAPDPQLHSHVVLHGAVRRGDGKVVAIESRAWLVHQRELGAAYRAQLAAELERLGLRSRPGRGGGAATSNSQGSRRACSRPGRVVTARCTSRSSGAWLSAGQSSTVRSTPAGPTRTRRRLAWPPWRARGSCCRPSSARWR